MIKAEACLLKPKRDETDFVSLLQKTKDDKEKSLLMSKINKLESLCRAMQAERQARKVLENENIGKWIAGWQTFKSKCIWGKAWRVD